MSHPKAGAKPVTARRAAKVISAGGKQAFTAQTTSAGAAAVRPGITIPDNAQLYRIDTEARIALIRQGIPASIISNLSSRMGMSKEILLSSLGLSRATISRKEKEATLLSKDESERVLGVETLIGMVQSMVEPSGDPSGFDAARWVSEWLSTPLPALADRHRRDI